MNRHTLGVVSGVLLCALLPPAFAQSARQAPAIASSDVLSQISMFSYREGPKSDLVFRGTPIAPNAEGKADVEFDDGNARIQVKVDRLPVPSTLGPYANYVLWTLTPDGRAANQGVVGGFEGGKGELNTDYGASQFSMIITAEPHFAVTAPSTMIVLYNVADKVEGTETKITTLVERSDYSQLTAIPIGEDPPELVQAKYAVAIARAAGAEQYAASSYANAQQKLAAAETALAGKRSSQKGAPVLAREAVIAGEDARRAAMVGAAEAATERERQAAATAANEAAAAAAARASETAAAAERERAAVAARNDLRTRLNAALPTRESSRGLVSEIGGVQFATGTADVSSSARESLARFAGIVASYPGLRFNVEGHTDNTGSPATNSELSLRRAIAVRDYLIGQGVPASSIDVDGFGPSMPIASNDTTDGRARNRRVEIVLSGGPLVAQ